MARTGTYTQIATTATPTATNTISFTSIPATYTDLVIVANYGSTAGSQSIETRVNGETNTSTSYSWTWMTGNGTTATSSRGSNDNRIVVGYIGTTTNTIENNSIINFMDYANTTTHKPVLVGFNQVDRGVVRVVGMYKSTSAISSIQLYTQGGNFNVGSTFTLYGIEAYR
jgi:hypothetical protein